MKKPLLSLAIAAALTSLAGSAKADPNPLVWNWSYSGGGVTGSGTFEIQSTLTTSVNDGYEIGGYTGYLVTGATGSFQNSINGFSTTILYVASIDPWKYGNDNLLLEGSLQPDYNGIVFRTSDANDPNTVWLYQNTPTDNTIIVRDNYGYMNDGYGGSVFSVTASTGAVPEPSTYALFGIGAIGMLMVMRRKKTA